jgi:hypothetical protein
MAGMKNEKSEEQIADSVADVLSTMGFSASSQDTGGGIVCIILQRKDGGELVWGTADVNWAASVVDTNGNITSSIETQCPSETQDVAAIVEAIKSASIGAGVRLNEL